MDVSKRKLEANPRDSANFCSVLFFWWTVKLFRTGYRKVLEVTDLSRPSDSDTSDSLGDRLEVQWNNEIKTRKNPSLIRATAKAFWREYLFIGILTLLNECVFRLGPPLFLRELLKYFRKESTVNQSDAIIYASGLTTFVFVTTFSLLHFQMNAHHYGMKVRIAMCSLVYRKALKLSNTALGESTPGKVVNLLANDVNRFDVVSIFVHTLWASPLCVILIGILLYYEIGWASFVGIFVIFLVVPLQSYTGKLSSRFRLQTALRTDVRVRYMNELISGIQVIKMYAWEKPFIKLIQLSRLKELKIIQRNSYVRGLFMTFILFTTRMALFCTLITLVYTGQEINAVKVFTIVSLFNAASQSMSQKFIRGVTEVAEVLVSFKRLKQFLFYEEVNVLDQNVLHERNKNISDIKNERGNEVAIRISNVNAKWENSAYNTVDIRDIHTLSNVSIDIQKGKLTGIIGPVGSGKSSLLQALLKELPILTGNISIYGRLSYSTQSAWIFNGTIKQNILFGLRYSESKYKSVVKICGLERDFQEFQDGDQTMIGEKGMMLSGGQKARINLARACYRDADIYLMDDPLSAVDAHVGNHLFSECIGPNGKLARHGATRVLVTHQVHFLKEADWIVVMKDGFVEMQGTPMELIARGIDLESTPNTEHVTNVEMNAMQTMSHSSSGKSLKSMISTISTVSHSSNLDIIPEDDSKTIVLEDTSKGKVKGFILMDYLRSGNAIICLLFIGLLFLCTQGFASASDYWVSYWTRQEEQRQYDNRMYTFMGDIESSEPEFLNAINNDDLNLLSTELCVIIHGCLVISLFMFGLSRSITFIQACVRSSKELHNRMLLGIAWVKKSVITVVSVLLKHFAKILFVKLTKMLFFELNPSGRILNRFSKDIGSIDELLPKCMLDTAQIFFSICGTILITSIANPIFLIPIFIIGIFFVIIRRYYLKTSKNLKRLEGMTKSPVFTHISETLNGLPTIRAFSAETMLTKEFDRYQNLHTSAWYSFLASSIAFGLSLDLFCSIFIATVTFYFVLADPNTLGDKVGLVITQAMSLTGSLQWGVRQSAEVSNHMMSVERVMEYGQLTPEQKPKVTDPADYKSKWPKVGMIEFIDVSYRYSDTSPNILKNISLTINGGEKIGIVGRTGAGKSSIVGSLFRLAIVEGSILIDQRDTATISLEELRSNISIIPQDPVLFSGTLRKNLDPFERYSDEQIWKALLEVDLKEFATSAAGLQTHVQDGGNNFSVGQRQLVCLARALLKQNKILVMDEATANVDPETDNLIQKTIRTGFKDCTILTVAHRLNTIIDCDRILTLKQGVVQEFDSPHILLQNRNGLFSDLVDALGAEKSEELRIIAYENYTNKNN